VAQALAQADPLQHLGGRGPGVGAALELERQHHVLERVEVGEQLEALEHEADLLGADRGAGVLVDREQVDAGEPDRASLGVSSPAMIDSSVLLPEPEAPTIATERSRARVKSMSWRIVRVPVESWTRLVRRSTTMMGSDMDELGSSRDRASPLAGAL
jgi:hypothetical protein